MNQLIPLHCLRNGESGQVGEILGDENVVHRLRELGLSNGATVEMVRSGSPCIIRLGEQKFCFRSDEVTAVLVTTGAPT